MSTLVTTRLQAAVLAARPVVTGRVRAVVGLVVHVEGLSAAVGELVQLGGGAGISVSGAASNDNPGLFAEVVSVGRGYLSCMPLGPLRGLRVGDPVTALGHALQVRAGQDLLGRVLDGLGRPIDGGPALTGELVEVDNDAPGPLERQRIREPLTLGVRALDSLVTAGRGQRLGLFAGSGVGKSTLLSMVAKGTSAPVIVLSLVGERGREVREFLEDDLGAEGMARAVAIVATSDAPPVVRLRSAFVATRIAEWFRDQGQDVLLLMDSLTRVAMAQREVGLSAGEPPASRGYPPSTFALLPRLLERSGPGARASITGIYTVLVEGDDHNEPIADAARSILDGHVALDRRLATGGHFPSIDVLESISRVAPAVTTPQQQQSARALRRLLAAHRDAKELIEVGAYVPGADAEVDAARALWPEIEAFLQQDRDDRSTADQAWARLTGLVERLSAMGVAR
jgi:flagellum-specific ATP synthase